MRVDDEDWQRIFGTSSSEIEKPPKTRKQRLDTAQYEAQLVLTKPELFGAAPVKPTRSGKLFDCEVPIIAAEDAAAAKLEPLALWPISDQKTRRDRWLKRQRQAD